ncbi:MAG: hypothetical protein JNK49_00860 [Planctomycetes bacterium]|nr:hypothetical protein [Planctomycetota bacterium]
MKWLQNLDSYTSLILVCLLAAPALGYWCYQQQLAIEACQKAIADAPRVLEDIGGMQKKVEIVLQNRSVTAAATQAPRDYFEGQILAAANQNLNRNDFTLNDPTEENTTVGKQPVTDFVAEVRWLRKELSLPLAFIYAVLFNCESGARAGGEAGSVQSIWKLRKLEIVNATSDKFVSAQPDVVPPLELEDRWSIRQMSFVRREPRLEQRQQSK